MHSSLQNFSIKFSPHTTDSVSLGRNTQAKRLDFPQSLGKLDSTSTHGATGKIWNYP
jgi:hypothetical protein